MRSGLAQVLLKRKRRLLYSFDFAAGAASDARITYAGGANGTRVNSSGLIESATCPRIDYNPVSLACLGLLVEEERTNLATYSAEWDNAAYTKAEYTISANSTVSPDGTTTADLGYPNSNGVISSRRILRSFGPFSGAYTSSVFASDAGKQWLILSAPESSSDNFFAWFNAQTGATGSVGSSVTNSSYKPYANDFYRASVSSISGGSLTQYFYTGAVDANGSQVVTANGTNGLNFWGAQIEAGAFATSYIPTTNAAVTRTADSALITGANFSGFYGTDGRHTLSFEGDVITTATGTKALLSLDDNTANERIELYVSGSDLKFRIIDGGATQCDLTLGTVTANVPFKCAVSFAENNVSAAMEGGIVMTADTVTLPVVDRLRLGSNQAGNSGNCHIKAWGYEPNLVPMNALFPVGPVINDEAADWVTRVYSNGGTASQSTMLAVSQFVASCKSANIWSKLNRVNLFAGTQLAAALVPLKVGGGNATDTNVNFVAGDYTEATGLTGNGTTKYLNTGLLANALTANDTHLALYNRASPGGLYMAAVDGGGNSLQLLAPFGDNTVFSRQYSTGGGQLVSPALTGPTGFVIGTRTASNAHSIYRNGSSIASNATSAGTLPALALFVFAINNAGTPFAYVAGPAAAYSIGSGLTAADVTAYTTIMETFQDALGRGVV